MTNSAAGKSFGGRTPLGFSVTPRGQSEVITPAVGPEVLLVRRRAGQAARARPAAAAPCAAARAARGEHRLLRVLRGKLGQIGLGLHYTITHTYKASHAHKSTWALYVLIRVRLRRGCIRRPLAGCVCGHASRGPWPQPCARNPALRWRH